MRELRTWIEIDEKALRHNVAEFLKLIPKRTRFMAVVKSNAYGHGLVTVAQSLANLQATSYSPSQVFQKKNLGRQGLQPRLWFGVDSIVEGLRLRREGIKNPILVLGSTLSSRIPEAAEHAITLAVSNFESLRAHASVKNRPAFHLKIDTGMHRQGFLSHQTPQLIKLLKLFKLSPQGVFTHFASAKDMAYPTYTLEQLKKFHDVKKELKKNGFANMMSHAAASGGALLFPESHLDMVRIGMAMYGYWPSPESQIANRKSQIVLKPVLAWKTLIAEIKKIPKGAYVGYDCTERVSRNTTMAVLPIGYWHGYDRGLSSTGEVLIRGKRARVLGRVSMDMIVVDATDISGIKVADEVVLIGKQGKDTVWGDAMALKISTSQYEVLTRINPLVKRIIV